MMAASGKELDPDALVGLQPLSDLLVELPLPTATASAALSFPSSLSLSVAQREAARQRLEQTPNLEDQVLQRFHAASSTIDSMQIVLKNRPESAPTMVHSLGPSRLCSLAIAGPVPIPVVQNNHYYAPQSHVNSHVDYNSINTHLNSYEPVVELMPLQSNGIMEEMQQQLLEMEANQPVYKEPKRESKRESSNHRQEVYQEDYHQPAQKPPKTKDYQKEKHRPPKSHSSHKQKHDPNARLEDVLDQLTSEGHQTDVLEIDINTLRWLVQKTAKMKKSSSNKVDNQKLQFLLTALTQLLTLKTSRLKQDLVARAKATRRQSNAGRGDDDDDGQEEDLVSEEELEEEFDTCCDCSLTALQVMTSSGVDRKLLVEDTLEQILLFYNSSLSELTSVRAPVSGSGEARGRGRPSPTKSKKGNGCLVGVSRSFLIKCAAKWSQILELLATLLKQFPGALTDTLVLSLTRASLSSFVLDSSRVSSTELQLGALTILRLVFLQYTSHQTVILEELLNAIPRLDMKRSSMSSSGYKVSSSGTSISLFAALLMQLVTSLAPPLTSSSLASSKVKSESTKVNGSSESTAREITPALLTKHLRSCHESAARVAYGFIQSLIHKCNTGNSAEEFRTFLDMFVGDLLISLHRPLLPASVLLLHAVIRQLVCNISGKASQSLKLQSLELIGNIASEFAKVFSSLDKTQEETSEALARLAAPPSERDQQAQAIRTSIRAKEKRENAEDDETKQKRREQDKHKASIEYWKALLEYFDQQEMSEEKFFVLASWLREVSLTGSRVKRLTGSELEEEVDRVAKPVLAMVIETEGRGAKVGGEGDTVDPRVARSLIRLLDCDLSLGSKLLYETSLKCLVIALGNAHNTNVRSRAMKSLAAVLNESPQRYAAALLQREDLQHALASALTDASTSVRESTIDLIGRFVLNSKDERLLEKYYDVITARILDSGVSVRKRVIKVLREVCATVFPSHPRVPEICSKLIRRISDDGEGIRKLVSETFTTLWFTPERDTDAVRHRVNCLIHVVGTVLCEGIGLDFLQTLINNLSRGNMTGSTNAAGADVSRDDDPNSAHSSAKTKREESERVDIKNRFRKSSTQLIGVIISEFLCGDQTAENNNSASGEESPRKESKSDDKSTLGDARKRNLYAMTSLLIFARSEPSLLVDHAEVLEPFLSHATTRINSQLDWMILKAVVELFELVIPLMKAPPQALCARLEESLVRHVMANGAAVMAVCVSCLARLVHCHTRNWTLVRESFSRFYTGVLVPLTRYPLDQLNPTKRHNLLRALYGVGLFMKHFRTEELHVDEEEVFGTLILFAARIRSSNAQVTLQMEQELHLIREKAVDGMGFMFENHSRLMLKKDSKILYKDALEAGSRLPPPPQTRQGILPQQEVLERRRQLVERLAVSVLNNLKSYLSDEAASEAEQRIDWKKEDLKSMSSGEDSTSTLSLVVQTYLEDILSCTTSARTTIRRAAVSLVQGVHASGNVHPIQIIPCLIGMSSDDEAPIRVKADTILQELKTKYSNTYINMKARQGIIEAFKLHSAAGRRGWRLERVASVQNSSAQDGDDAPNKQSHEILVTGRLASLYAVLAGNRANRRALINSLLKYFDPDPQHAHHRREREIGSLDLNAIRLFVCDNLAWLPYGMWDEPLYLLNQLEVTLSLIATYVFDYFKDLLKLSNDEDLDSLQPELSPEEFLESLLQLPSALSSPTKAVHKPDNIEIPLSNHITNGPSMIESNHLSNGQSSLDSIAHSSSSTLDSAPLIPNHVEPVPVVHNEPASNSRSLVGKELQDYCNSFDASDPATRELLLNALDGLKAWYQAAWLRLILRELFTITEQKMSEYTPADSTKQYEKAVHRRNIDANSLDYIMRYPVPDLEKKLRATAQIIKENGDSAAHTSEEEKLTYLDCVKEYCQFRTIVVSGFERPPAVLIREWSVRAAKMEAERAHREKLERRQKKDEELKKRFLAKNNLTECVVMLDDIADIKDLLPPTGESDDTLDMSGLGGLLAPSAEALAMLSEADRVYMNMDVNFRRPSIEEDSLFSTPKKGGGDTSQLSTPMRTPSTRRDRNEDVFLTPDSKPPLPSIESETPPRPLKITLKRKRGPGAGGDEDGWASGSLSANNTPNKKQKAQADSDKKADGTGWGSDASESESGSDDDGSGSDSDSGNSDSESDSGSDSGSNSEKSGSGSDSE